jgi:hypothetical protein
MDREHGICRRCKQIVRTDWRVCAHCGVTSPIPRTAGQRLGSVAMVAVMAGAGWWAVAEADASGRLALGARGLVHSATTIEEQGRPVTPSVTSGAASSGELGRGVGTRSSDGTTSGVGTGGGPSGLSGGGPHADRTRSDEDGDRAESRDERGDPSRMTRFGASVRAAVAPRAKAPVSAARPDSDACASGSCGVERPVGATGDTLAAAMRRAGSILAGTPGRDRGRTGTGGLLLPPPLVP